MVDVNNYIKYANIKPSKNNFKKFNVAYSVF